MAEPLSVAASVLAVVLPAIKGAQLLLEDLKNISDAPETLETLRNDLNSITNSLLSLQDVKDADWASLGGSVADDAKLAIRGCQSTCNAFHNDLRRWAKHSGSRKSEPLSLGTRMNIGLFKQPQINAVTKRLQASKHSLNLIVGTATLHGTLRMNNRLAGIETSLAGLESNSTDQRRRELVDTEPSPFSTVPFPRDTDYVDRGCLIDQLQEKLSNPSARVALQGLGGIGKSQLAIEYSYRSRERSPEQRVFWVYASNPARFEQSIRSNVEQLKISGPNYSKEDIFKVFRSWLRNPTNGKWLVILDNADDPSFLVACDRSATDSRSPLSVEPLIDYVPVCEHGTILMTTRSKEAALTVVQARDVIEVKAMDEQHAVSLLERKLGHRYDAVELADLATTLEYIPLALTQAAALIRQRAPRYSVQRYLEDFKKNAKGRSKLLNRATGDLRRDHEAENSVLCTWQLSFEHIYRTRRSAADLLALMSLCDRCAIPESLLQTQHVIVGEARNTKPGKGTSIDANNEGDEDFAGLSNSDFLDAFEDDILTLRQYSLIWIMVDPSLFEMHRLVQHATREWLEAEGQLETTKERLCNSLSQLFNNSKFENWPVCESLFPHVKSLVDLKPQNRPALLQWASILATAADYSYNRGVSSDAESMSVQSWKVRAELLGYRDWRTVQSVELWAIAWTLAYRWQDAFDLEEQVLELNRQLLGDEHKCTLASMCNLARILTALGRLEEAENLTRQALMISEKTLGAGHEYTISMQENLGAIHGNRGDFAAAEKARLQVLEARRCEFGSHHPSSIMALSNLAVMFQYQGRWDDAEKLEGEAVGTSKRVLGADHPDTLTSMGNLAATYSKQGRLVDAETLERQVLESRKRVLGDEHPDALLTAANLACTLNSQGRSEEALELIRDCVARSRRIQGVEHDRTKVWEGFLIEWTKQR